MNKKVFLFSFVDILNTNVFPLKWSQMIITVSYCPWAFVYSTTLAKDPVKWDFSGFRFNICQDT